MTKQESKGETRRREVVAHARAVLVEAGYDKFSLRDIAGRADMKLGNLQYYFPTKEELVEATVRQELAENLDALAEIAGQRCEAGAALREVAIRLVSYWLTDGAKIYAVMSFLALHEGRFRDLRDEVYANFYAAMLPFVKAVQPNAPVPQQKRRVRVITALLDGALMQGEAPSRGGGRPTAFVQDIADAVLAVAKA